MLVKFSEESEKEIKIIAPELTEEEIIELSKKFGKEEYERVKTEKYTPTEEEIEVIEKTLENYPGPVEFKNSEEPIKPTEEDLIKMQEVLDNMKPQEVMVEEVTENVESEETGIKRLRYTKNL